MVINNIVVTAIDATTIGAIFKGLTATGAAGVWTKDNERSHVWSFKVEIACLGLGNVMREGAHVEINADGRKGTTMFDGTAIGAAEGDFWTDRFSAVLHQGTDRGEPPDG